MIVILARLYWEFFQTGLFAVGGGMATLPFLKNIGESTGWYSYSDLMNMLAVSESTPGPIGINMATYVGYQVAGIPGVLAATLGEVTPSIMIILFIAMFLTRFRENPYVQRAFYGLRPASAGLIGAACVGVVLEVLTGIRLSGDDFINHVSVTDGPMFLWGRVFLAALLLILTNAAPKIRDLHPAVFIAFAAVIGVLFRFGGA